MPLAFGRVLRRFREERRLSLRELGQLVDVDHAYIQRLETGEKEAPSDEVLQRLLRVLKVEPRVSQILQLIIGKDISQDLVDLVLEDPAIDIETMKMASQVNFRGKPDWRRVIREVDKLRKELKKNG